MNADEKRDLISYRLKKAKETFQEIHILIENKLWNTAVSRLYYSCFYAISALLVEHDFVTKTHTGARQLFGLHFIKPGIVDPELGRFYSKLFELRHSSDYNDFMNFGEQEVLPLIEPAEKLINRIEEILK
jgi:uncharacterized protein (UPF0332 family)